MGVVLNDEVKSIAYIKSQISDQGEISGRFTKQSADDLALTLRSGALPAPIEYMEERTVGPSLGADSIRSGVRGLVVGLILVVVFMLVYYRGAGVNAVVALILNMILMLCRSDPFQATLTLQDRGHYSDNWYGSRLKCPDLRARSGRIEKRQDYSLGN